MSRRFWRWTLRFIEAMAAILVIGAISLAWYTRTESFRTLLRDRVLAVLNDSINGEVKFRSISGSVWHRIVVHNLEISQNGTRVLSAPTLAIDVGLLGQIYTFLSSSSLRVSHIEIDRPTVDAIQDREQKWNVLKLVKQQEETGEARQLSIYLDDIQVENGALLVRTADAKEARLKGLSGKLALSLLPDGIQLGIDRIAFGLSMNGIPESSWTAALSIQQDRNNSTAAIRALNISTRESRLSASGTIRDFENPTAQMTLDLRKAAANEVRSLFPTLPLREDLAGRIAVSGKLSALKIDANVAAHDGRIIASVLGDFTRPEPVVRGNAELQNFYTARVLAVPIAARIDGRADFAGSSVRNASASFQSHITGLAVSDWQLGRLALDGKLESQHLTFTANIDDNGGRATLSAKVLLADAISYDGTLNARALDVKPIVGNKANLPNARLNLDLSFNGTGTDPSKLQAETKLTLFPSQIGEVRIDEGQVDAAFRNGTLDLRQARILASGSVMTAKGTISSLLEQRPSGKLTYSLNLKEIQPWLKLAGYAGTGTGIANGSVAGSLQAPQLDGNLTLNRLDIAGTHADAVRLSWNLVQTPQQKWQGKLDGNARGLVTALSFQTVEAHADLQPTDPLSAAVTIQARDSNQHVHRLAGRLSYSPDRTDVALQTLTLQLLEGTWSNPRPIQITLAKKVITVSDFVLQKNSQSVAANGTFALDGAQDLSIRVSRFPLADVRALIKDAPDVTGFLSLTMRAQGTAARPLLQTDLTVDQLTIAGMPYAGLAGRVAYADGRANVDLRLRQDQTHDLTVSGFVPVYIGWGGGRSMGFTGDSNLRIRSDGLSPAFVSAFTKEVQNVQGTLTLDIVVRGTLAAPAPNGSIQFQNGAARIRSLGLALSSIDLQANLTPAAIQIVTLTARSGDGQLTGNGRMGYKGTSVTALGINLKAQNFQVINTREYKAEASGDLLASGTLDVPQVRGSVTVKGTLRPNLAALRRKSGVAQDPTIQIVRTESDLASGKTVTAANGVGTENSKSSPESENGLYRRLTMDVSATIARPTWIHLEDGSIETTGQITFRKRPYQELTISGTIEGIHGFYNFQGRQFQIDTAQLTFSGGTQIDPALNIIGVYKTGQYEIDLVIGGYMTKPTLSFKSDPVLDQGDILSVLLFGKPASDLSQGQKTSLQNQALQATANFISSDLRQSVAHKLGLDTLQFGATEGLTGGQLEAGKYVTSDIFVSTSQQFGNQSSQEYSVEYDIAPNWQIKSSTTPHGNSGIDIFWRKKY